MAGAMPNMRRGKYDPCNKGKIEMDDKMRTDVAQTIILEIVDNNWIWSESYCLDSAGINQNQYDSNKIEEEIEKQISKIRALFTILL